MEPSATMVTGLVGERLQAGTEDTPVFDGTAPQRCLHDSGVGYKFQTYLLTYNCMRYSRLRKSYFFGTHCIKVKVKEGHTPKEHRWVLISLS